jgi:hypothetical protein
MQRGPCRDDTERFEERLAALAKRPRLVSSGRQHAATHPVTYLTKYLVRPLNEILGCMLLATGLQIFWRLAPEPEPEAAVEDGDEAERVPKGRPRIELIYAPANRPAEVLAFMELTTPHQLPDSSMRILADSLRLGLIKVDSRGSMVLATPLPLAFRSNTCRVLGPVSSWPVYLSP